MKSVKTQQEAIAALVGREVKIIGNSTGHGWAVGQTIRVTNVAGISATSLSLYASPSIGYNIYWRDFEFVEYTVEEFEKQKKELEAQMVLIDSKIAYLKETGQTNFDDTEFKVWNTLQVLKKSKVSDLEKAKAIAALIKS